MTKCILIFNQIEKSLELLKTFEGNYIFLSEATLIIQREKISTNQEILISENKNKIFKSEEIEQNRILNPKLDREIRQKSMQNWLMPFGFIAGLTFSNMTNLSTFSFLGLNNFGELIFGGLLGMGSGYLGSFFASASINLNRQKEIRPLINAHKNGKSLLILENQSGYELPWNLIKESEPEDLIFLEN